MRIHAALVSALVLVSIGAAGCGGGNPEAASSPANTQVVSSSPTTSAARIGQPFRNGAFEIVVSRVAAGVSELSLDDTATSGGLKPFRPENGQFVLIHLAAKLVGNEPTSMSSTNATLSAGGKVYSASGPYLGGLAGQGLDQNQQPGTTKTGFIVFDLPATVASPDAVTIQSDDYAGTTNPPSVVALR